MDSEIPHLARTTVGDRSSWWRRHRIAEAVGVSFMVAIVFAIVWLTYIRRNPIPRWLWDVFDWKVWPLNRLR
jgi:hypothetical protein